MSLRVEGEDESEKQRHKIYVYREIHIFRYDFSSSHVWM